MANMFYDIESLHNVFTLCNFDENNNIIDIFYLWDNDEITKDDIKKLAKIIYTKNKNFKGKFVVHNLKTKEANYKLAKTFGLSDSSAINNPTINDSYDLQFRITCDTDDDYNADKHPYLWGYNSYNYDTTILTEYLYNVFSKNNGKLYFDPTTAKYIRTFNDTLFEKENINSMPKVLTRSNNPRDKNKISYNNPRWVIRKNMLMTGRHLDVARLNEKMTKVALKRLLGMRGYQILESDKLDHERAYIDNKDQMFDLIAYNISDVVNLAELFKDSFYQGQFELKKGLIDEYPETIYEKKDDSYEPNISKASVRRDRLTIDSSSANFATKTLCPYGHLTDLKTVSFKYPNDKAYNELIKKGVKITQRNILDELKEQFYNFYPQKEIRENFDKIYNFYKRIEGKNFNDSKFYKQDYGVLINNQGYTNEYELPPELQPYTLNDIDKNENNIFYYDKNGNPTSCFATFSIGGIHGAEINTKKYLKDMQTYEEFRDNLSFVKSKYPDPLDLRINMDVMETKLNKNGQEVKKPKKGGIKLPNGRITDYKEFLVSGATIKKMEACEPHLRHENFYRDADQGKPEIFTLKDDGSNELNKKYVYTSIGMVNHEDFKSYYPNMLRMLNTFDNKGLGYDRYGEFYDNKEKYGKMMKSKEYTDEEKYTFSVLRNGTKLILNAASGAGDTNFGLPIQMNNYIISMRIIGQLFAYQIGMAQTYHGAKVPSTNTDGLYTVMEAEENNRLLEKVGSNIGIDIEPEEMLLISKDSNNRLEFDPKKGKILNASGVTLSCYKDTNVTSSLAHPAIVDWALSEYLIITAYNYKGLSIDKTFDVKIGKSIIESAKKKMNKTHLLRMFGNVLSSSKNSMRYIFGMDDDMNPIIMQHYNRVYIMNPGVKGTVHLYNALAKKITPAMEANRKKNNELTIQHDDFALSVLLSNGLPVKNIPQNREAKIGKITKVDTEWNMLVCNESLYTLDEKEQDFIIDNLNIEQYVTLVKETYENNWMNKN